MEGRPLDDEELVRAAKDGDVGAYEQLMQRYQAPAGRLAYLITRDAADAEDATQDAFVKAYYALLRFRLEAPFRPWLFRIVANEARNRLRSAGRRAGLVARAREVGPSGDAAPSPEVAAVEHERRQALLSAVNGLADKHRLVIACRFFMGLSEQETAAALGVPKGTVKSRLSRALSQLRASLETSGAVDLMRALPEGAEE